MAERSALLEANRDVSFCRSEPLRHRLSSSHPGSMELPLRPCWCSTTYGRRRRFATWRGPAHRVALVLVNRDDCLRGTIG